MAIHKENETVDCNKSEKTREATLVLGRNTPKTIKKFWTRLPNFKEC